MATYTAPKDPLVIKSGELRNSIEFLYPDYVMGDSGSETIYKPFCVTRAKIEPFKGTELIKSSIDTTLTYFIITMRWRPGIHDKMRIRFHDSIWRIQLIEDVLLRHRKLVITAEEFGEDN
jgi:head-tail adaptor